jgi:undecaprenyl-diphosphatase
MGRIVVAEFVWRALVRLDYRVFRIVAGTKTPWLDRLLRSLSVAANRSLLWLGIAGVLGLRGGNRGQRAALRGVGSIVVTSALVNHGVKRIAKRPRPSLRHVPAMRRLSAQPATTSFPSGHAASAFAFAVGASSELPAARAPLITMASAVAYSRVYVGVHYPLDVIAGAAAGAGLAAFLLVLRRGDTPAPTLGDPTTERSSATWETATGTSG